MKRAVPVVLAILLAGCAARSYIQPPRGQTATDRPAPHGEPVCLMRSPLPSSVTHTVIGQVNSSKRTYGTVSELIPLMADDARAAGADAIINLKTGQKMGAFAWARPVGTGLAVKIDDKASFNCIANGGELR